jgi:CheY-like chemotaxis protein
VAQSPGPGLGSEFTVRLPGIVELAVAADPSPAGPPERRSLADGGALRILIVDDSAAVATSLSLVLSEWDYVVEKCLDGFSALAMARQFRPDVVLTDLGMPRMNGYQLVEQMRLLPELQRATFIAFSGYCQEADRQKSAAAGFAHHLTKPIDLPHLSELLQGLAGEHLGQPA